MVTKIGQPSGYVQAHEIGHGFGTQGDVSQSPISGPATGEDYSHQSCLELVQNLAKTINKIVDREVKKNTNELDQVEKDHEARKAGGFWDKIVENPIGEFFDGLSEAKANSLDIQNGKQDLLGQYSQYLDLGQQYAGMGAKLVSGVTSNVMNELGVINQITEAAGMGSLIPTSEEMSCDPNLLVATVGTVTKMAGTVVDNALQSVFTVQATVGLAFDVVPDLYAGLMNAPVGTLSILLTNRETIFSGIESIVTQVVNAVPHIREDDYPFDHRSFVLAAQGALQEADSDLGRVESTLEAGGKFLDDLWDKSKDTIEETAKDLMGIGAGALVPGFFNSKFIELLSLEKQLEAFIQILVQRQEAFATLVTALGSFKTTMEENAKFESLMAPLVQQVRCRLQTIIEDMGRTVEANALLRYFVKEKAWGIELFGLAKFMEGAGVLGKPFSQPSSELNDLADGLSGEITAHQDDLTGGESFGVLIFLLQAYLRHIKRKIAGPMEDEVFISTAKAIETEIDSLRKTDSDLSNMLTTFQGGLAGEAGLAVLQAASLIYNFMDEMGLDEMLTALKRGDWNTFFSANTVQSSLEKVASQAIGDVLQCCADNAGDGDTTDRLMNMNRTVAAFQRGKDVFDEYSGRYALTYIDDTIKTTIPELQRMKADAQRVSNSPCINQGQAGGGVQSRGLTLV